jgi:FMN phosphatase YigB (HAD superfamily)
MKVLLFDCDGVLGDTERFGHLVAFNQMWREFGVPWAWSVEEYGRKLAISGGRERMRSLFDEPGFLAVFPPPETQEERDALIARWHRRKTELYTEIIESGRIRREAHRGGRPGRRLAGWRLLDLGPRIGRGHDPPCDGRGDGASLEHGADQ